MAEDENRADRFASGTGSTDANKSDDEVMPGVTGGDRVYLPQSGRAETEGSAASSAEGTIGAVGEMDSTGAPAGTSGAGGVGGGSSSSTKSEGGGPGGGAV
jgi:hypothetical protein